jgi:hypothetical protein
MSEPIAFPEIKTEHAAEHWLREHCHWLREHTSAGRKRAAELLYWISSNFPDYNEWQLRIHHDHLEVFWHEIHITFHPSGLASVTLDSQSNPVAILAEYLRLQNEQG